MTQQPVRWTLSFSFSFFFNNCFAQPMDFFFWQSIEIVCVCDCVKIEFRTHSRAHLWLSPVSPITWKSGLLLMEVLQFWQSIEIAWSTIQRRYNGSTEGTTYNSTTIYSSTPKLFSSAHNKFESLSLNCEHFFSKQNL